MPQVHWNTVEQVYIALQKFREKPMFRFFACTLFRDGASSTPPSVEPNINQFTANTNFIIFFKYILF